MSNELHALLDRVAGMDPDTAKELRRHVEALQARREYGLNFERHTPESVDLTGRPISIGDKVRFLPPRGETEVESKATWVVTAISSGTKRVAKLVDPRTQSTAARALDDLVFVADFRDAIYPGLARSGDAIKRGGDKPFHTVINAENFHALETLMYTHEGSVDCIYIDPPYNTRDNDWKYNNDYVDPGDSYAHSKWLAFMERRLKLAKRLLNPSNSVLIVTIDEKEYLRLGLLLEQVFRDATIQMVTYVTSPQGSARGRLFKRSEEYAYFVFVGDGSVAPLPLDGDWDGASGETVRGKIHWASLKRTGTSASRRDRESMFYPVFLNSDATQFVGTGPSPGAGVARSTVEVPDGCVAVWPIRTDKSEGRWQVGPEYLASSFAHGFARLGRPKGENTAISYLKAGERKKVGTDYIVVGHRDDGSIITKDEMSVDARHRPTTVWNLTRHSAGHHGSSLLRKLIPERSFPFPKSLYAVEDTLRFIVADKPEAIIVDFFAGSGTTAHAVMRLNRKDGGRRQSISVTNNEVNSQEDTLLTAGLRPGDQGWDSQGIYERVTKPRIAAAATGRTPEGIEIEGDYAFVDTFSMAEGFEENIEFFTLTYENEALVEIDRAFERIAPLLWLKAGATGRIIDKRQATYDLTERYGVLFSVDAAGDFLDAVGAVDGLQMAFIVTNDESLYQAVAVQLPRSVQPVRLYESYLRTFEINNGRV